MTPIQILAEDVACKVLKVKSGDLVPERKWALAVDMANLVLEALLEAAPTSPAAPAALSVLAPIVSQPTPPPADSAYSERKLAKLKGYTGDECPDCGNFTMVRNGTCLKCDNCGSTTGCS